MGRLIALIAGQLLGPLIFKALALLGISVLAYVGVDEVQSYILSKITELFSGLPTDMVNLVSLSGFDHYLTIIVSAYLSVFAFNQFTKAFGIK